MTSREPTHWSQAIFLRLLVVRRPHQVAAERSGGREDALELQRGDHVGIIGVVIRLVFAGIEGLEARRQDDRPDLDLFGLGFLVVVDGPGLAGGHALHALGADAAVEAALRLPLGLFLGIALGDLLEGAAAILRRQVGHHLPDLAFLVLGDLAPALVGLLALAAALLHIQALEVAVDGLRRLDAAAHRLHRDPGAGVHVARREDAGPGGFVSGFIHFDVAPAGQLDAAGLERPLGRFLADGRDDHVHRQLEGLALDGHRPAPARGVGLAQLHLLAEEAGDLAVSAGDGLQRRGQVNHLDAFAQGLLHFVLEGRHLFPGTAVDDGHVRPQPDGAAGHVDGHVAAADDGQALADLLGLAQVVAPQELDPLDHARGVLVFNAQGFAHVAADAQEDRLIALLLQGIQGEVPAQGGVGLECPPPGAGRY